MRRALRGFGVALATSFRADPWRALVTLILTVIAQVTGVFEALALKWLVDAAINQDLDAVTRAAVFAGVLGLFGVMAGWASFSVSVTLRERVTAFFDSKLISLTTGIAGLEHHERTDYLDELEVLRVQRAQLAGAADAVIRNVALFAQVGSAVWLLAGVDPLLLLLPVFGVPSLILAAVAVGMRQRILDETAEPQRAARHLFDLTTTAGPGKELRIFGVGQPLIARHRDLWRENDRAVDRVLVRSTALTALGWACFALGFVGAMALVLRKVLAGDASLGEMVLTLTLAAQVNELVQGAANTVAWLTTTLKTVGRFLWLVDYAAAAVPSTADRATVPHRLRDGIRFEGVGFRYPATEVDVLRDVTLHVPAGSTVAVVGDNGAGKTTLIKLLCRFYEPTEGRITIDGVDLARMDPWAWRERTSAGFQDFSKFELLARETVGVGDLPGIDDDAAVGAALDRASAGGVIETLPAGLGTQLGRSFDDGVELSGGQWQKLALGRAMMREAPLLLVLDEPTASLDAETEHALFERYAGAARRVGAGTGAITVLVSHRFSTVRMADLIVVVDGGLVTEVGSHADLVAHNGLYAELFELQARAYR